MTETLNSGNVSTKLERIAELARKHPARVFFSLGHTIDVEFLREAYRRTRKGGAPGVDGQTAQEYEANLGASAHCDPRDPLTRVPLATAHRVPDATVAERLQPRALGFKQAPLA